VHVHENFRAILTSNPEEYAGVHKTQDALVDRLITVDLGHFDRETEIEITKAKSGLPTGDAERIVDIVRELRSVGVNNHRPTIRACIAIAKILAQNPLLILADEPIASLDLVNGELVMGTLQRIARDLGLSVVATLHHVDFARRYADRVLGFQAGRLVFDGIPGDLRDEALRELFGAGPADSPAPEMQPVPSFQLVTS
jgi:MoxR-like ATPase